MEKNKKILLTVIFAVLAAGIITAVLLIADHRKKETQDPNEMVRYSSLEEAMENAGFRMTHTDRLSGWPVSGYSGSKTAIAVMYYDGGFIRKALHPETEKETEESSREKEGTEHLIDGMTVIFLGSEDKVKAASWTDNGFDYLISLEEGSGTASEEEMTAYVRMTR